MSDHSGPILRPYQQDCVDKLRASYAAGRRAPLLQLATGGGKTLIFTEVTRGARAKGRRVLIVGHRRELLKQASTKLTWAGVQHGIIAAGFDPAPNELVQVGSVQTLTYRLKALPAFDLIVFDEAHHCQAGTWRLLLKAQAWAKLLGVTATPARLDGKGLGIEAGGCFDDLISGPSIHKLMQDGYLSSARCFVPEQRLDLSSVRVRAGDYVAADLEQVLDGGAIIGDAVVQYRNRADHQPAIAFCCTVEHAEHVAEAFRTAGYRSACVHGKTPAPERDALIAGLGNGSIEVLTSCDLISEGLDVPSVGAVILLRPTQSVVLHMQQVGRGMRPVPGKEALIVLDHVGNVLEHGLPDVERIWSLAGTPKIQKQRGAEAPVWRCDCGCLNPVAVLVCMVCDEERPGRRQIESVPGDLAEVTAQRLARARSLSYPQMLGSRLSEAELREFARARGYKSGWAWHRFREQEMHHRVATAFSGAAA